ncbi:hypothetical protein AFL01nite_07960 [Aeromicrobium flavum]|uniref:SGNH domain-containing protein n=1 Tax=Aeromicrobium flavum TaxID=416568 RepID=A0A512HSP2_9ACTN|nr:SGNH hydrolase domain-containing protein [Aeromicrobium flavum]GEO88469.1 hypothetical protein AFL01nite_07960 [Aeromicrobium flavum]
MVDGGRVATGWRTIPGAALALSVLGLSWPGRLPGADVATEILLVAAGALLGHALLVERDRPIGPIVGAGLRLLVPPALALVATALVVQRWIDVRAWERQLRDVREAAVAATTVREVAADSPVAVFWVVALLVQSAALVLLLRWVAGRLASGLGLVVLALSIASFCWWALDPASHLGARFWPVGLGVLVALALAARPEARAGRGSALIAWCAAAAVAGFAVLGSGGVLATVVGAVVGLVLVLSGPAPGSPATLPGPRLAGWFAVVAWASLFWAGPALRLAPEVIGRELGLRDRAVLLLLVGAVAVVLVGALAAVRAVVDHVAAWAVLAAASVAAAVLVTSPGLDRLEAIEADVARAEAAVTRDLPACFGAVAIASRAEGRACRNPELDGVIRPGLDRAGADFEPYPDCWSDPRQYELKVCDLGGPGTGPKVLVLGDSHARVLLGAFRRLAEAGVASVSAAAKASCGWSTLPLRDSKDPLRGPYCDRWRAELTTWLERHATDYDVIVTTAYNGRMKGPKDAQVSGLVEAWEPARRAGVPVVALRDNPRLAGDTLDCLRDVEPGRWAECDVPQDEVVREFDPFEPAAERAGGAHFVDTTGFFCVAGTCPAVIGGVNVYRDYNHVSATYAGTLAPVLYRAIARTGVFEPPRSAARAASPMSH